MKLTPAQKMMQFILHEFKPSLDANEKLSRKIDNFWDKISIEEDEAFQDCFNAGFLCGQSKLDHMTPTEIFNKFINNEYGE